MEIEWLPNGGVKTVLCPRSLTRVFEGRKERRVVQHSRGDALEVLRPMEARYRRRW